MRQTFPFSHPKHKPAQALAALKSQVRKYLKRERRKELPEGVDYWDFDCRIGPQEDAAQPVHVAEIVPRMDALAAEGCSHVYVEILAKPGHRMSRAKVDSSPRADAPSVEPFEAAEPDDSSDLADANDDPATFGPGDDW